MDIRNNWGEKKNFFSTALHIDVYLAIFALQPRLLTDPRRPPKCVLFNWPPSYHHVPSSKGYLSNASHEVVPDANAPEHVPGRVWWLPAHSREHTLPNAPSIRRRCAPLESQACRLGITVAPAPTNTLPPPLRRKHGQ